MTLDPLHNRVPVLHEDEHFVVVVKPAGLKTTARDRRSMGVVQWLGKGRSPDDARAGDLHATNRLTPGESGLLVLAKSVPAADAINELFRGGRVQQRFIGVTRSHPKSVLKKPDSASRAGGRTTDPKSAELAIQVIRAGTGGALLEIRTSGRRRPEITRVLRGHRLPILGDSLKPDGSAKTSNVRCFLHLAELRFRHPFTGKQVQLTCPTPPAFTEVVAGHDALEDALDVALNGRLGCLADDQTDVCRLINGQSEGVPGLVAERYGQIAALWTVPHQFVGGARRLERAGAFYRRTLRLTAVYHKVSVKDRGRATPGGAVGAGGPLVGEASEPEFAVSESGMKFLIRPDDGLMTGLFLDQRSNRGRIRELAAGRRVLNTFAYTCSFSVAAALGGAAETVSVDLAKRALEWGKRNFELNDVALDDHKFICSEIFDYFKRARRQGRRFDIIILDPPTFARSKKPRRVFTIAEDLEPLIAEALAVLDGNGVMLISTNARAVSVGFLRAAVEQTAATRPFRILAVPRPPPDCAADRQHSKSVLVQYG
ncbi:MAG: class I SAM-dependent methyltransferase [Planctomycetes bacterium]|nr:class I SAM-dependent methyltransferase [Planctomycetota bacterium]